MDYMGNMPSLVETNVRSFLNMKLQQSHQYKLMYYNGILNTVLFALFIIVVGGILIYKYKGRPTPEEKARKDYEKQQYILSTIRNQQLEKMRDQQTLITGLPHWDTEYSVKF
jgi:hypothetical protein